MYFGWPLAIVIVVSSVGLILVDVYWFYPAALLWFSILPTCEPTVRNKGTNTPPHKPALCALIVSVYTGPKGKIRKILYLSHRRSPCDPCRRLCTLG